jgi:hypothetical protein
MVLGQFSVWRRYVPADSFLVADQNEAAKEADAALCVRGAVRVLNEEQCWVTGKEIPVNPFTQNDAGGRAPRAQRQVQALTISKLRRIRLRDPIVREFYGSGQHTRARNVPLVNQSLVIDD